MTNSRELLVVIMLSVLTQSACMVVGGSRKTTTPAYVLNGLAAAAGTAMVINANRCKELDCLLAPLESLTGALFITGAVAGTVVTLVTARSDDPASPAVSSLREPTALNWPVAIVHQERREIEVELPQREARSDSTRRDSSSISDGPRLGTNRSGSSDCGTGMVERSCSM